MTKLEKQNLRCASLVKRDSHMDCMVENMVNPVTKWHNVSAQK